MKMKTMARSMSILGAVAALSFASLGVAYADTPTPAATAEAHERHAYQGTLKSSSASGFVLTTKRHGDITVAVNADTKYRIPGNNAAAWGDFKVGDRVGTLVFTSAGVNTAKHVTLIPAKPLAIHRVGTVKAYTAGSSITLEDRKGESSTFAINAETKILMRHNSTGVVVGARAIVLARREPASDSYTAKAILVFGEKPGRGPK